MKPLKVSTPSQPCGGLSTGCPHVVIAVLGDLSVLIVFRVDITFSGCCFKDAVVNIVHPNGQASLLYWSYLL